MNIIRIIAKSSLLVICAFTIAAAVFMTFQDFGKIQKALPYVHPITITVFVISLSGITSFVFHVYCLIFIFKQPHLVKLQINFNFPSLIKYSPILFAISLLSLLVQGYVNNAYRIKQIDSDTIIMLGIIFIIAISHSVDLYFYSKKIKLHNIDVVNELEQIGM